MGSDWNQHLASDFLDKTLLLLESLLDSNGALVSAKRVQFVKDCRVSFIYNCKKYNMQKKNNIQDLLLG